MIPSLVAGASNKTGRGDHNSSRSSRSRSSFTSTNSDSESGGGGGGGGGDSTKMKKMLKVRSVLSSASSSSSVSAFLPQQEEQKKQPSSSASSLPVAAGAAGGCAVALGPQQQQQQQQQQPQPPAPSPLSSQQTSDVSTSSPQNLRRKQEQGEKQQQQQQQPPDTIISHQNATASNSVPKQSSRRNSSSIRAMLENGFENERIAAIVRERLRYNPITLRFADPDTWRAFCAEQAITNTTPFVAPWLFSFVSFIQFTVTALTADVTPEQQGDRSDRHVFGQRAGLGLCAALFGLAALLEGYRSWRMRSLRRAIYLRIHQGTKSVNVNTTTTTTTTTTGDSTNTNNAPRSPTTPTPPEGKQIRQGDATNDDDVPKSSNSSNSSSSSCSSSSCRRKHIKYPTHDANIRRRQKMNDEEIRSPKHGDGDRPFHILRNFGGKRRSRHYADGSTTTTMMTMMNPEGATYDSGQTTTHHADELSALCQFISNFDQDRDETDDEILFRHDDHFHQKERERERRKGKSFHHHHRSEACESGGDDSASLSSLPHHNHNDHLSLTTPSSPRPPPPPLKSLSCRPRHRAFIADARRRLNAAWSLSEAVGVLFISAAVLTYCFEAGLENRLGCSPAGGYLNQATTMTQHRAHSAVTSTVFAPPSSTPVFLPPESSTPPSSTNTTSSSPTVISTTMAPLNHTTLLYHTVPTAALVFHCALYLRHQLPNVVLFAIITRTPSMPFLLPAVIVMAIVAAARSASVFSPNPLNLPGGLATGYVILLGFLGAYLVALRWFLDRSSRVSFVARQRAAARVEQLRFESKALRAFAGELVPRRGGGGADGGASTVAALHGASTATLGMWLSASGSAGGVTHEVFSRASPRAGPPSPVTPPTAGAPAIQRGRHPGSRRVLRQAAQALRSAVFVRELVEGRDYGPRAAVLCVGLLQYAAFTHHLRPHDAAVATVAVFSRLHEVLCPAAFGHPPSADEPDATERLGDAYVAVFGLGDNGDGPQGPQAALLKASRCLGAGLSLAGQWAQQRNEAGALILPPLCFSLHCGPAVGEFPGLSPSTARYSLGGSGVEAGLALLRACASPDHVTLVSAAAIDALGPAAIADADELPTTAALPRAHGNDSSRPPAQSMKADQFYRNVRHNNAPDEDGISPPPLEGGRTWGSESDEPAVSITDTTARNEKHTAAGPAFIEGFARVSVNLFFEIPTAPSSTQPQPQQPQQQHHPAWGEREEATEPRSCAPGGANTHAHSPDIEDHRQIPSVNAERDNAVIFGNAHHPNHLNQRRANDEKEEKVGDHPNENREEDCNSNRRPRVYDGEDIKNEDDGGGATRQNYELLYPQPLQHYDGERGPFFTPPVPPPPVAPEMLTTSFSRGKEEEEEPKGDDFSRKPGGDELRDTASGSRTQTPASSASQGQCMPSVSAAADSSTSALAQRHNNTRQHQPGAEGVARGNMKKAKEGRNKPRRGGEKDYYNDKDETENISSEMVLGNEQSDEEDAANPMDQHPDLGLFHEPFLASVSRVAAARDTSAADAVVAGITATRRLLAEVAAEQRTRLALITGPLASRHAVHDPLTSSTTRGSDNKRSHQQRSSNGCCAALTASVVHALQPLTFADPATEHAYTQRHLRYEILYVPRLVTCVVGALSNLLSLLNLALEADGWATLLRRADIDPHNIPEDVNSWSTRHLVGIGFGLVLVAINVDAGLYFFWSRRRYFSQQHAPPNGSGNGSCNRTPDHCISTQENNSVREGEAETEQQQQQQQQRDVLIGSTHEQQQDKSRTGPHPAALRRFIKAAVGTFGRIRRHVLHTFALRATAAFATLHLLAPSSFAINGGLAAYALAVGPLLIDPMPTVLVLPLLFATFGVPAIALVVTAALHPLILLTPATVIYLGIAVVTAVAARLELDRGQRTAFAAGRLAAAAAEALDKQVRMRDAVVARVAAPSQRRLMALMAVRAATPPGLPDGPPLPPVDDAGAFGAAATAASALAPDRRVLRLVAGGQPVAVVDLEGVVVVRVRVEPGPATFDRPASAEEAAVNEVGWFCAAALLVARVDALLLRFPLLGVVEARGCEIVLGGPWGNGAGGDGAGPRGSATAAHAVAALQFLVELRQSVADDGGGASIAAVATVDDVVVLMRNPLYPVFDVCGPGALRTRELLRAAPAGSVVCTDGLRRVASLALPTAAADRLMPPLGPWAVRGLPVTRMYAVIDEDAV